MTRAKRYEGEKLRAEEWHNMGRDKAWEAKRRGMPELERIVHNKLNLWAETRYDAVECGYLIVVAVGPPGTMGMLPPLNVLFTHAEPALEFPSDHLKTKLLMITGGTPVA